MRDEQRGDAEVSDYLIDGTFALGIRRTGGLVEQQKLQLSVERPSEH